MPEQPPMMPGAPKSEKSLEEMTIDELNSSIEQLDREIDELNKRLQEERTIKRPDRSRGDELLDRDTATDETKRRPQARRRKGVQEEATGTALEMEIARKMRQRVERIFRRDELLGGGQGDQNDSHKG